MNKSEANLTEQKAKKPYSKPEIVYQQPLEAIAAVCTPGAKLASGLGGCTTGQS